MNNEEIQALMAQLQNAGLSPEDIADGILWPLFRDGKMSKEDLSTLCGSIGLELDEEFENDNHPAPAEAPKADDGGAGEVSKNEAEDLKEIKPGESKEEFESKIEEAKEDNPAPAPAPAEAPGNAAEEGKTEENPEEKSEDEEWDEVKKNIFKL